MKWTYPVLAILLLAAVTGCDDDDDGMMAPTTATLTLAVTGLDDLGSDFTYEGWLIVNGSPVSTGTFDVAGGVPDQTAFTVGASDLANASTFVLSIEPSPDQDPAPAATKYLAGNFVQDTATLTVSHAATLGDDFTSAAGPYILNTPSTAADQTDYAAGIWWLDPAEGPGPTLVLPTLPAGWMYEGWVVGGAGPLTTGRFTMAGGVDSDGGGPTAGDDPTPPFPGQDYIDPLLTLTSGYAAVISIEPEPDNSPAPFTLKPLVDMTIDDPGIGVLQTMANQAAMFPTGSVSR